MPRGDGTGPQGRGPGTGRGAGPCSGGEWEESGKAGVLSRFFRKFRRRSGAAPGGVAGGRKRNLARK